VDDTVVGGDVGDDLDAVRGVDGESLPWTVVAELTVAASAADTLPGRTW